MNVHYDTHSDLDGLFLNLIDKLSLPLAEAAARRALGDFAAGAGFEYYAYAHLAGIQSFAVSNYPREWQDFYLQNGYLQIDPVVTRARHGKPVFTWSASEARRMGRRDVTEFFAAAIEFGIRSGLSISVPVGFTDRMIFTLSTGAEEPLIGAAPSLVTAAVAVAFIHSRFSGGNGDASLATEIRLSPREAECLRWYAEGMSMPDIAATVGIAYRSVRDYLDSASRKLKAANSRQAASIAIRLGLI